MGAGTARRLTTANAKTREVCAVKKTEPVKIAVIALVLVTSVVAVVYLTTRPAAPEGTLRIENGGRVIELPLERLELVPVRGSVVNGRGEERAIAAQGVLLSEVLREAGISEFAQVAVTADDAYSAAVTAEEIHESDRVYLIQQEEGGLRLIVFGDSNSKRSVSNVASLSVR